jgi:hypothetical protein
MRIRTRTRFSPHVLVLMAVAALAFFPIREAIASFVLWKYASSFRQVEFKILEIRPNEGYPYAYGRSRPDGVESGMPLEKRGNGYVVTNAASFPAVPGARLRIWWSDEVPSFGYGRGRWTNGIPVAFMPELPGVLPFLSWLACAAIILYLGGKAIGFAARQRRRPGG